LIRTKKRQTTIPVAPNPANTTFSGVVLDSAQTAIPGATITIGGTAVTGTTDAEGQFLLTGVPVGNIHLHIDPTTSPRLETFPPLEFETVTIAGNENILGQPIILPEIDMPNAKVVGGPEDVVLSMKDVPGVALKVFANSVTFPDGSKTGTLSMTQVQLDKAPMPSPLGTVAVPVVWTLKPAGVVFDPPAQVTLPNSDALPPGTLIDLFQFDHALFLFTNVGKGTVSEDGLTAVSDPGFGITRTGWGCGARRVPTNTGPVNCNNNNRCIESIPVNGGCVRNKLTKPQTVANLCFDGCINGNPIERKEDAQCCREAQGSPRGGWVACCNGNKTACADVKGTQRYHVIWKKCIEEHEEVHFNDLIPCPNDQNSTNACRPTRIDDFKKNSNGESVGPQSECNAYKKEIDCLNRDISQCNGDSNCIFWVNFGILEREKERDAIKPSCND
jgi:hypothetical protein